MGNWKMYATSIADAHVLATAVRNNVAGLDGIDVVLCPPFLWLSELVSIVGKQGKVKLGGQDVFYEKDGAYTGEISPLMLKEMANFAIVGHSERREYFGESDMEVNEKVIAALKSGITPIICVGEKKKNEVSMPVKQLKEAIAGLPQKSYQKIVVAYEPIWAIGTGNNADAGYVAKVVLALREIVHLDTPILYGGSVNSKNALEYAARPEINGLLIGGASVRSGEFVKICKDWSKTKLMR